MREVFPIWTQLYRVGFSTHDIAEAYNVSRTVVRKYLLSCNVKFRNGSQAHRTARLMGKMWSSGYKKGNTYGKVYNTEHTEECLDGFKKEYLKELGEEGCELCANGCDYCSDYTIEEES